MPAGLPTRFVVIVPPPPPPAARAAPPPQSQSGQAQVGPGWPTAVTWLAIAAIVGVTLWYFGPVVGAAAGAAAAKIRGGRKSRGEFAGFDGLDAPTPSTPPAASGDIAAYSFGDMAKEAPQIGGFEFGDIAREDVLKLVGGDPSSSSSSSGGDE